MNALKICAAVIIALSCAANTRAEEPAAKSLPQYTLTLHSLLGADGRQWVFVLATTGQPVAVATPDALRKLIENGVPEGATLSWSPACCVIGGEPMRTNKELETLADFCKQRKVKFVIIPAG